MKLCKILKLIIKLKKKKKLKSSFGLTRISSLKTITNNSCLTNIAQLRNEDSFKKWKDSSMIVPKKKEQKS